MKTYIGTKIVHAEPQNDPNPQPEEQGRSPGYKVVYEDGYISWSPKEVFERCYREVTEDEYTLVCTGDES